MVSKRRASEHPNVRPGAWRRGWPVLLALMLLVTGSGLGGPGGLAQALRGGPQAGAGAADSRDPALLRSGGRHAVLTQRSADPAAGPAPIDPALAPPATERTTAFARAGRSGLRRDRSAAGDPPRAYRARAPPAAA